MRLKEGVNLYGVNPYLITGAMRIDKKVYREILGYELVITSANDSVHSDFSRHYIGCAIDIRTWVSNNNGTQLVGDYRNEICRMVRQELYKVEGAAFRVIDEPNHFHIELTRIEPC